MSIYIEWTEPITANGIIQGYTISYTESGSSNTQTRITTDNQFSITSVNAYTAYSVFVQAMTISLGPASNTESVQTLESGKNDVLSIVIYSLCL